MKRLVAIVAILSLLLGAGVALWPETPIDSALVVGQEAPRPPPLMVPEPKPVALVPAAVTGGVHRGGKGVAGAVVIARGERETLTATTAEGGGFLLSLPPGAWLISARFGDDATRAVGPLTLGAGEQKTDVVLELLPSATLEGVVLNEQTREPISRARVVAAGVTVETNAAGRFQLKGVSVGEAWIEVSAKGFLTRIEWASVEAARVLLGMEITLTPSATVKGTVTRQGQPVAGARVWTEGDSRVVVVGIATNTTTDLHGAFELEVAPGRNQLAAAAPSDGRVAGPEVMTTAGAVLEGVQIELGEQLYAAGRVSLGGDPAPNAQLLVFDARSGRLATSTISDAAGNFAVVGLAPGAYLVQVKVLGVDAQRGPFQITGGGDHWDVVLERAGSVVGRVAPPGPGVVVRLRSTDWVGQGASTTTDAAGRFSFEGLTNDAIVEAESPKGYAEARVKPNEEVTLTLEQAVIQGVVTNEHGRAVTDFAIRLRPAKGGAARTHAVLSPTGRFRIAATPGEYEVSALAPGAAWAEPVRASTSPASSAQDIQLRLVETTVVEGRVVDAATRTPIRGAEVQVRIGNAYGGALFATGLTNSAGSYRFASVPLRAGLRITAKGYSPVFLSVGAAKARQQPDPFDAALQRGEVPEWQQPYEGVGLSWQGQLPQLSVGQVFSGAPAEEAGILPGDLLISIDGRSVNGMNLEQVINSIRGPAGTAVRLGFSRGGQPYEVTVRRRAISL